MEKKKPKYIWPTWASPPYTDAPDILQWWRFETDGYQHILTLNHANQLWQSHLALRSTRFLSAREADITASWGGGLQRLMRRPEVRGWDSFVATIFVAQSDSVSGRSQVPDQRRIQMTTEKPRWLCTQHVVEPALPAPGSRRNGS